MDIKTVFFLLLSFLLGGHNQFAADDNASAANFPYKFGEMRLLSSHSEITTRYKKIGSCLVVDGIEADCRYHDWHGISYVVFEGEVVRIEANRESLKKGARLPFGLAVGDGRALVLKKLLRYRNVAGVEALLTGLRSGGKNVSVPVEDKSLGQESYQFYLVFDGHDDLLTVGSMVTVI